MKKAISLFLSILMVCSIIPGFSLSAAAEDGVIEVRTVADLYAVRNKPAGNYILMDDIDLTQATKRGGDYDYNGTGWSPIGESASLPFSGTFDGNGHSITGMRIQDSQMEYIGLFGYVTGTVKNLVLLDISVNVTQSVSTDRNLYCGGIAGCMRIARVENCVVSGTIKTSFTSSCKTNDVTYNYTGGICGLVVNSSILLCTNNASVESRTDRLKDAPCSTGYDSIVFSYCGGIGGGAKDDGSANSSSIKYCVNNGNIYGTSQTITNTASGTFNYAYAWSTGICAYCSIINACKNNGNIRSTANTANYRKPYACGIGSNASISSCINTGLTASTSDKSLDASQYRRAIGYADNVSKCYYLRNTAPQGCNSADSATTCVSLSAAQMLLESSFGNLDFNNTWFIDADSGVAHPQLINNPDNVYAESISVNTPANTTFFTHHSDIDVSGLTILVKCRGVDEPYVKTVSKNMISGYDADTLGEQTVTINYLGCTATYSVTVVLEISGISFDKTDLTLDVGQNETISVNYEPENATNQTVTWESDDESVATVDENGTVTAVGKGEATITATTANGKTASCDVTVLQPVATLTIAPTATVAVGAGIQLNAVVDPSDTTDTLTWKTSAPTVATVDQNGYVEGVATGTANITLTTSRGVTASCTVTVIIPATAISFGEATYSVDVGQTITLAPALKPANTTDGVSWSSSEPGVATVSRAGVVTGKKSGTTTITATTDSGISATCTVKVSSPITSIVINKTKATVDIGGTVRLSLTITPEETTDTISWSSSNRGIATVKDGLVTAVAPGKAVITAAASSGESSSCTVYVREAAPEATVDSNRKVINNLEPNSKYLIEGVAYTANSIGRINILDEWFGKTIEIQTYNDVPECIGLSQTLTIPDMPLIEAPSGVKVANAKDGVNVSWAAVNGAQGYYVYRKTGSGSYSKIATTTALSYLDKTAQAGTAYTYAVRAYNGNSLSGFAGVDTVRLTNPAVKVANAKAGVNVTWGKVTGAKGYYVYRKTGSGSYSKIATTTALSYVDKTAKAGTTYTYAVRAYNGGSLSAYKGVKIIRLANTTVKLANQTAGIKVSWTKVAGAKGYYVYRKTAKGSYAKIATIKSGTTVSYVDKTAKAGTAYTYAVRAYNGSTQDAFTAVSIVRLTTPNVKLANTKSGPKATWGKVAGAKGYYVYRKTAGGSYKRIATTTSRSYVDKTAKSGTRYYYIVKAYNGKVLSSYAMKAITCKK